MNGMGICFYIKEWNKQPKLHPNNHSRILSLTKANRIKIQGVNEKRSTTKYLDLILKLSWNHRYKPANGKTNVKKPKNIKNKITPTPGSSDAFLKDSLNALRKKNTSHNKVNVTVTLVNIIDCLFVNTIVFQIHYTIIRNYFNQIEV